MKIRIAPHKEKAMIRHAVVGKGNTVQTRFDEAGVTISTPDGSLEHPFHIPWNMLCYATAGLAGIMPIGSVYKDALEKVVSDMPHIQWDFEREDEK